MNLISFKRDTLYLWSFRTIFVIVLMFLLCGLWFGIRIYNECYPTYESMIISDWLINYEGGFVRRGLAGQILLELYKLSPQPIANTIIYIYFLGLISLFVIIIRTFREEGLSLFISIFPAFSVISFLDERRDYWMLIISFCIFSQYAKFIKHNNIKYIIYANILSVLSILFHEASFFFTIPILLLITLFKQKDSSFCNKCIKTLMWWAPALVTMVSVCLNKGNESIANTIWDSWMPCFVKYPLTDNIPPLGDALEWLSHDTLYAFNLHFKRFWLSSFIYNIPSWPFTLYSILAIYYLVSRLNTINLGIWKISKEDNNSISSILIIQLLSLSPMFGFLSCDFGRVVMYWVISSLFVYHWLKNESNLFPHLQNISQNIQNAISRNKWLSNRWTYLIVLITIPIADWQGANIVSCFSFVPYGWRLSFWKLIIEELPII